MKCETITTVEQCAVRADTVHVRHAIVEVNVVMGVLLCGLLVGVRVIPVFVCDAVVHLIHSHSPSRSLCFHVDFAVLEEGCLHYPSVTVDCRQLLPNFELYCSKLILRIISAGYVFVVMLIRRMPPGSLPAPPRRRIALRPSVVALSFILFVFELSQG